MLGEILRSQLDRSINVVDYTADGGAIESRFVQRLEDTIIIYLSSSTGCDKACRFCHLTQMRQTMMTHVTIKQYLDQAKNLLELLLDENKLDGVKIVHFNFMARGDAMANPHFVGEIGFLIKELDLLAIDYRLEAKFKISTIFPQTELFGPDHQDLKRWARQTIRLHPEIEFYYSLYSLQTRFRRKWIPKAIFPDTIGEIFSGVDRGFRLHHALIAHENDSLEDGDRILSWLDKHDITCRLNIVRYNPFGKSCGKEPTEDRIELYRAYMNASPRIVSADVVTRVGRDVAASCGTFIQP